MEKMIKELIRSDWEKEICEDRRVRKMDIVDIAAKHHITTDEVFEVFKKHPGEWLMD